MHILTSTSLDTVAPSFFIFARVAGLIPAFAAKEILTFAQKLAKLFDLQVYHESYDDVKQFNIADLYSVFSNAQRAYLSENTVKEYYYDLRMFFKYIHAIANDLDIVKAANEIAKTQGGKIYVKDGEVKLKTDKYKRFKCIKRPNMVLRLSMWSRMYTKII